MTDAFAQAISDGYGFSDPSIILGSPMLDGKVAGFSAFQDLVHIDCCSTEQIGNARSIAHQSAGFHFFYPFIYCGEPNLLREFCNLFSMRAEQRARHLDKNRLSSSLACCLECALKILRRSNLEALKCDPEWTSGEVEFF